jgi:hypothetical protein
MRRIGLYFSIAAIVLLGVGFYGCSNTETETTPAKTPASNSGEHDEKDHAHGDEHKEHGDEAESGETAMQKMEKGLAKLSEEDRASAMKQHMCPVSGEMLGTMGEPVKVTVKDQDVWICCDGCKKDLLADPDRYLAKLKK